MSFNFLTGLFHKANQGLADPMAGIAPQLPPAMGQPTLQQKLAAAGSAIGQAQQQPQMQAPAPMAMQQIQAAPVVQGRPVQGLLMPQQATPLQRPQPRGFYAGPLSGGY